MNKITQLTLLSLICILLSCSELKKSDLDMSYNDPGTPLILISIDGFRWDYLEKTDTPYLDELVASGT